MTSTRSSLTPLLVACAALALNGFVLGSLWLFVPTSTFSETAALPAFGISQQISWVLLTALVVLVPTLLAAGPRRRPPAWLTPLVQVALAAQATTQFVMGFVAPWLAQVAPFTLDIPGGMFQAAMTAVWIAFIVAMVLTATALWRAGHSRVGCVLMVLGALVVPGVGPIGTGVLAVGLGLTALRKLRSPATRDAQPLPEPASDLGEPTLYLDRGGERALDGA